MERILEHICIFPTLLQNYLPENRTFVVIETFNSHKLHIQPNEMAFPQENIQVTYSVLKNLPAIILHDLYLLLQKTVHPSVLQKSMFQYTANYFSAIEEQQTFKTQMNHFFITANKEILNNWDNDTPFIVFIQISYECKSPLIKKI